VNAPTIACISTNPALDRRLRWSKLMGRVEALPGEKNAHVAVAAHALGAKSVWFGFLGSGIADECSAGDMRIGGVEVTSTVSCPSSEQEGKPYGTH